MRLHNTQQELPREPRLSLSRGYDEELNTHVAVVSEKTRHGARPSLPLGSNNPRLPVTIVRTCGKPGRLFLPASVRRDTWEAEMRHSCPSQSKWYQQRPSGELELSNPCLAMMKSPPQHLCQQRLSGGTWDSSLTLQ